MHLQIEGNTPLHYAVQYAYSRITAELLKYGADESIQNNYGKTPWEIQEQ